MIPSLKKKGGGGNRERQGKNGREKEEGVYIESYSLVVKHVFHMYEVLGLIPSISTCNCNLYQNTMVDGFNSSTKKAEACRSP